MDFQILLVKIKVMKKNMIFRINRKTTKHSETILEYIGYKLCVAIAWILYGLSKFKLAPKPGFSTSIADCITCGYWFNGSGFPKFPLVQKAKEFQLECDLNRLVHDPNIQELTAVSMAKRYLKLKRQEDALYSLSTDLDKIRPSCPELYHLVQNWFEKKLKVNK